VSQPLTCGTFRQWLFHFQADEVSEADRAALQAHLDACPGCARRFEVEESLLRGVKTRLRRDALPPALEARVRRALADEARSAGAPWFRRPAFAAAAAALLLALVLVPGLLPRGFSGAAATGGVTTVRAEWIVVDLDCDRAGVPYDAQRRCNHPRHYNVLRAGDGSYWNIGLDGAPGRALFVARELRGHRMRVEGRYYPGIRTLQVVEQEDLGPVAPNAL